MDGGVAAWQENGMPKRSSTPPVPPETAPAETKPEKNPAAVALGRLGGKKGGAARAASLTKKERSEIASKAAKARWAKPV